MLFLLLFCFSLLSFLVSVFFLFFQFVFVGFKCVFCDFVVCVFFSMFFLLMDFQWTWVRSLGVSAIPFVCCRRSTYVSLDIHPSAHSDFQVGTLRFQGLHLLCSKGYTVDGLKNQPKKFNA